MCCRPLAPSKRTKTSRPCTETAQLQGCSNSLCLVEKGTVVLKQSCSAATDFESCNKLDLSPALLRKRPHRQKVHSGNTSPSPHSKNRREEGRSDAFSRLVLKRQLCSAPLLPHGEFTRTTAPNGELEPSRPLSPALPTQRWHEQRLAVLTKPLSVMCEVRSCTPL